jgi:hypothetical protein
METINGSVIVELYDLPFTQRKDDRFGRVVINGSFTEDDLIDIAVSRRTDLNASTLRASMDILKEIAEEKVLNGSSVRFGLSFYQLGVEGVFVGNNPSWDNSKHSLTLNSMPVTNFRSSLRAISVYIRGMAGTGTCINQVTDVATQSVNSQLTPGGGVNISGSRIKIVGEADGVGLFLINQANMEVVTIPLSSVLINKPSKISFVVPASLPAGDYKLSLGTQYTTSKILLKETRTYTFEYMLSVTH